MILAGIFDGIAYKNSFALESLICYNKIRQQNGDNNMKKITLTHLSDSGHGWLKIDRQLLSALGIVPSCYSYQRKNSVYLEEDCDAPRVINELERIGVSVTIKEKCSKNKLSKIRSYESYHAQPIMLVRSCQ